jgi:hypothetical protein
MEVMGSGLSDFVRAQQHGEQRQEDAAQERMREKKLPNDQHRAAQKRSGRSSA